MHIYKLTVETVAYVEARSVSEAKEMYHDGEADLEDSVITEIKEISSKEYDEILSNL